MSKFYHSLESEKYFLSSLQSDQQIARQKARASAEQAITNLIIIVLAVAAGFYAIKSMPVWLPVVESSFHKITNYRYI
ncbi:hypothetical protein [Mariniblastus fucicola]|uniref:Uncharacterized protein n=1 Tax=Mariniblastus fucicola TaxID=980251 RepID=A0A5B9PBX9_9BACT|nr:hypothetical protein [Mariniblastus fucicola]QEG22989.1 hypothetical protein MFFC18_28810 [Mariniblastus fucicola]